MSCLYPPLKRIMCVVLLTNTYHMYLLIFLLIEKSAESSTILQTLRRRGIGICASEQEAVDLEKNEKEEGKNGYSSWIVIFQQKIQKASLIHGNKFHIPGIIPRTG